MTTTKETYKTSQDWEEKRYLGLGLDCDYDKRLIHLSMLEYIASSLMRLPHLKPRKLQDQPHPHIKPKFCAKVQHAEDEDDSPLLGKIKNKFIQEVTGTFLYYA